MAVIEDTLAKSEIEFRVRCKGRGATWQKVMNGNETAVAVASCQVPHGSKGGSMPFATALRRKLASSLPLFPVGRLEGIHKNGSR